MRFWAWFMLGCSVSVYSAHVSKKSSGMTYVAATRHSRVTLVGFRGLVFQPGVSVTWSVLHPSSHTVILLHIFGSTNVTYGEFYQHQVVYHTENGSLSLKHVDLADSGIYETLVIDPGLDSKKRYCHTILYVQEILGAPLIVQTHIDFNKMLRLRCVVKRGVADTILWFKGGKPLHGYPVSAMSAKNRTVTLDSTLLTNCEEYTCVIKNHVSQNQNSHVLLIEDLLLIHLYSLLASVLALLSTSTSLAASIFIIFFALGNYKVHKRHVQLTAVFVFFQLLSSLSLLNAALFCLIDPNYSIAYKITEGFIIFLVLAMMTYLLLIYMQPENPLKRSFLLKKYQRNIFLVYQVLAIFISIIPVYRGQHTLNDCGQPVRLFLGPICSAVVVYLFTMGLLFMLLFKYMKSWSTFHRLSRDPPR